MKRCMLPYQLCRYSPKAAFSENKYCMYVLRKKKKHHQKTGGPAMQLACGELNFPNLTGLGELQTLVHFLSVTSLATLLLQLSLILVCLALCFRVV